MPGTVRRSKFVAVDSIEEFTQLVGRPEPAGLSAPLRALLRDAAGEWDRAHEAVQDDGTAEGAWVHAYLHRKDGDLGNAAYWYRRAGRPVAKGAAAAEWRAIAADLLSST